MIFDIKPPVKEEANFEKIHDLKKSFLKRFVIIVLIFFVVSFYFYHTEDGDFLKDETKIINVYKETELDNSIFVENFEENLGENFEDENLIVEDLTDGKIIEMEKKFDELEKSMMISSEEAEKVIKSKVQEIILALKNKNFEKLSSFVNSNEKLIFAPYCYIKPEFQSFSKDEVKSLYNNQKEYIWGNYNGATSEEIKATFNDYYENFIYDQDFSRAEKISYNKILGKGNMINNIQDFFPNSIIVEYHFSGFNPEFEGMDWKSLRLVFIKFENNWYLKAIIHDNWTV